MLFVDVCVGKMFFYGFMFGCLDFVFMIVVVLSGRSSFVASFDKRDEVDFVKKFFVED